MDPSFFFFFLQPPVSYSGHRGVTEMGWVKKKPRCGGELRWEYICQRIRQRYRNSFILALPHSLPSAIPGIFMFNIFHSLAFANVVKNYIGWKKKKNEKQNRNKTITSDREIFRLSYGEKVFRKCKTIHSVIFLFCLLNIHPV